MKLSELMPFLIDLQDELPDLQVIFHTSLLVDVERVNGQWVIHVKPKNGS